MIGTTSYPPGIGIVIAVPIRYSIEKLIKGHRERKEIESKSVEEIYQECYREILRAAIHKFAKERQQPNLALIFGEEESYNINPLTLKLVRGMKKSKSLDEKVRREIERVKGEITVKWNYNSAKFRAIRDVDKPSIPVEYEVLS